MALFTLLASCLPDGGFQHWQSQAHPNIAPRRRNFNVVAMQRPYGLAAITLAWTEEEDACADVDADDSGSSV